jgi:hypothetical protein
MGQIDQNCGYVSQTTYHYTIVEHTILIIFLTFLIKTFSHFFTFYIILIIFYYYSNKKIHYNTIFFYFFIQILFTLYHIITFYFF